MSGQIINPLYNLASAWQGFWAVATSKVAIIIYLIILLLGIALVVIFAMISENRSAILQERADAEADAQAAQNGYGFPTPSKKKEET